MDFVFLRFQGKILSSLLLVSFGCVFYLIEEKSCLSAVLVSCAMMLSEVEEAGLTGVCFQIRQAFAKTPDRLETQVFALIRAVTCVFEADLTYSRNLTYNFPANVFIESSIRFLNNLQLSLFLLNFFHLFVIQELGSWTFRFVWDIVLVPVNSCSDSDFVTNAARILHI